MNKKILNVIIGISILILLIICIGADGNLTNLNNSADKIEIQETNLSSQIDTNINSSINLEENQTSEEISSLLENVNNNSITNETTIYLDNSSGEEENNKIILVNITNDTLSQPEITSSGSSNSGGNSGQEAYYIDSTDLSLDNATQSNNGSDLENTNITEQEKKENPCSLQSPGKRAIEIKDCEGIENVDLLGIYVNEVEKNELEKEVIISSEEHFNKTITINTSLTTESEKENIHIYWENEENLEITLIEEFSVRYYDEDNNGLIDIVSWDIPHLSEQIFKIVIDLNNTNESSEQLLLSVIGPTGQTRNPINFNVNVNYSGNFSCNLKIGGEINKEEYNLSSDYNYSLNLPNGNYTWEAYCFDITNGTSDAKFGNFSVKEGFSVNLTGGDFSSTSERMYFLDLVKNDLKSNGTINIHSENTSNLRLELKRDNVLYYTQNISIDNSDYSLPLNKTLLNLAGIYNLTVYFDEPSAKNSISRIFSVASANLTFNTTQIQEGQSIKVTANVISPLESISYNIFEYGNGTLSPTGAETSPFTKYFLAKYSEDGAYTVKLTSFIGGIAFTIQKNGINVTNVPSSIDNKDDDSPSINLLEPEDEAVIYDSIVNFSYKASDNVKIQNCTFKLYNADCTSNSMTTCSTNDLIFPLNSQQKALANNSSVQNNKKVEVNLKDFEDGFYMWEVECYDNSSNSDWEERFFKIINGSSSKILEDYEQEEEVESLKKQADAFLTKDFNLEEREVLEDLNILNDTKYYKRRLLDIQQFLEENYKYVSSEALREKKTNEYLDELEDIKNKIPKSITIKESNEYIKNSVDKDFESIVQDYFDSTNTKVGKISIQKLARINKELQNEISVSAKVKNIEIEYNTETRKITLVKKEINLNNDSYNKILEIIPKEIAKSTKEITFLTENNVINEDPTFEVNYENLDKKEIIYYFNSSVNLKDLEKTETILFEDDLNKFEAEFTGFFVSNLVSLNVTFYFIIAFILLVVLLFIAPFALRKFRILRWRKEPNVVRVMNLIEDIERFLKEKEIEKAREKYYKIKEIYPVLPYKTKAYFYKKINEMLVRIDRKDIFGLVKEYQEAKRKWNKEDYMRLYEDIKKIYERLPEKDRKRVYDIINGY